MRGNRHQPFTGKLARGGVMTNLLEYKIKKIIAKHGYLKKSDLTTHELSALNKGAKLGQKGQAVNTTNADHDPEG